MSLASKLTLIASSIFSVGTVFYIHFQQELDREKLHLGVIRDLEKQRHKKVEEIYSLHQQIEFTEEPENNEKATLNVTVPA